ncbi:hypothetical protein D9M71_583170 [compost metagenome]
MLHREVPAGLENVEVSGQVGLGVDLGVVHRVAHPGLRRQVDNSLEAVLLEQTQQAILVDDVELVDAEVGQPRQLGETCFLERHAVVVVEVVDADHLVPFGAKPAGGVETDETGGAGDQELHALTSPSVRQPRPMP